LKRGRDITSLHLKVEVFQKLRRKKYSWICSICNREYIAREDAEDCENYHSLKEKYGENVNFKEVLEQLESYLNDRHKFSRLLLQELGEH